MRGRLAAIENMPKEKRVYVCINKKGGKACIGPKSRAVFRALHKRARERGEAGGEQIEVERIVCMGYCSHGPNVKIHGGDFFHEVTTDDVENILDMAAKP